MLQSLEAFAKTVTKAAGLAIVVGLPSSELLKKDVVLVWPWRLTIDPEYKSQYEVQAADRRTHQPTIHCIIFAPDLARLGRVHEHLDRNPVLCGTDPPVQVMAEPLPEGTLLNLFIAATLVPRPCLAYGLKAKVKAPTLE